MEVKGYPDATSLFAFLNKLRTIRRCKREGDPDPSTFDRNRPSCLKQADITARGDGDGIDQYLLTQRFFEQ